MLNIVDNRYGSDAGVGEEPQEVQAEDDEAGHSNPADLMGFPVRPARQRSIKGVRGPGRPAHYPDSPLHETADMIEARREETQKRFQQMQARGLQALKRLESAGYARDQRIADATTTLNQRAIQAAASLQGLLNRF